MSSIFLGLYIFMGVIIYFRLRVVTSFSSIHCFVIALTSSIPALIRNVCLGLEFSSRYLLELGFILGGTDTDELTREIERKSSDSKSNGVIGDE